MAKSLVIVESPTKAKTIGKYLGKQFVVKASLGHVKDLPKKDLAVDVEHDFKPRYEVIEGKKKLIAELKQAAKGVDSIYLAADPDREGEAICWHLKEELEPKKAGQTRHFPRDVQRDHGERRSRRRSRSRCGERPPGGGAAGAPRAGPAGRLQDLAAAVGQGPPRLSAGRVQTVALRLIVEREREIRAFQKQEYWTIDVALNAKKPPVLTARLQQDATTKRPRLATKHGQRHRRRSGRCGLRRQVGRDPGEDAAIRCRRSSRRRCSRNPRASCASA